MASPPPPRPSAPDRRRAVGLLALLALGAIGIGAAAVLLVPPAGSPSAGGGPGTFSGTTVSFAAGGELIAVLAVGLVLLFAYMRFAGPGGAVPKRFLTLVLVYFLVAIGFLALVHLVGSPVVSQGGTPNLEQNGTGTPVNSTPTNFSSTNSTLPSTHYTVAFWYLIAGAVGIAVAGLLVALWYLGRPGAEGRIRGAAERDAVGEVLRHALRSLDAADEPRTVLIRLYGQLLLRVSGSLPEIDAATPREIERACVRDLGIPPGPSSDLRSLFERARYSTLPMTASDVDRARGALREALAALQPAAPKVRP